MFVTYVPTPAVEATCHITTFTYYTTFFDSQGRLRVQIVT